jgi:hypothetical protein
VVPVEEGIPEIERLDLAKGMVGCGGGVAVAEKDILEP